MRTDHVWTHFDKAFEHANEAFAEANKAFAEAEKAAHDPSTSAQPNNKAGVAHQVKFEARNASERWRLACRFLKLGLDMALKGRASLRFKHK